MCIRDRYIIEQAYVYSGKIYTQKEIKEIDIYKLYEKGYSTIQVKKLPDDKYTTLPINFALKNNIDTTINIGEQANFIIKKDNKIGYIVVNGFLQKVEKNRKFEGNGLVIK